MTHFIETFADETAYNEFKDSSEYVTPNVSVCSGGSRSIFYNPKDYSLDYFTTVAKSDGTISFSGSTTANTLSYSIDGGESWTDMTAQTVSVNVNSWDKVLWKGNCTPASSKGIGKFTNGTATFDVKGNVMSLLFGDAFKGQTSLEGKNNAFYGLLDGNTKVISAENLSLPATTLANWCYSYMFNGCTGLTSAPALHATTLAVACYGNMFNGCTSLTTAPELPATELAEVCYASMFNGCTSLTTAPALHATTLAVACYEYMFANCSLETAPELPARTLYESCYEGMFANCSLETAPELPATTLAHGCYASMFQDCTSLTTAPELPATKLAANCYNGMFNGCTSLRKAPVLSADTLTEGCYLEMFYDCSLNSITCLATDISAHVCTTGWVDGVPSSGTFTKAASMTSWTTGVNGIPTGWTVVDKS